MLEVAKQGNERTRSLNLACLARTALRFYVGTGVIFTTAWPAGPVLLKRNGAGWRPALRRTKQRRCGALALRA